MYTIYTYSCIYLYTQICTYADRTIILIRARAFKPRVFKQRRRSWCTHSVVLKRALGQMSVWRSCSCGFTVATVEIFYWEALPPRPPGTSRPSGLPIDWAFVPWGLSPLCPGVSLLCALGSFSLGDDGWQSMPKHVLVCLAPCSGLVTFSVDMLVALWDPLVAKLGCCFVEMTIVSVL